MALARLAPFADKVRLILLPSVEAAATFDDLSVDFVYVDAVHDDPDAVMSDLRAWWPKLAPGGIIAGHDWTDQHAHRGVRPSVSAFAVEVDRTIYLTSPVAGYQAEACPSWYVYRDGMPGPEWRRC